MKIRFSDWLADWRGHMKALERTAFASITMREDGKEYEVLLASHYDAGVDKRDQLVKTSSSDFDNRTALLSRRTRDTGIGRLITSKGKPLYVIEQGSQAVAWGAAIEGIEIESFMAATYAAHTWRDVRRPRKTDQLRAKCVDARKSSLDGRLLELKSEELALKRMRLALAVDEL